MLGPYCPQEKPAGSDQDPVGQGQPLPLATLGLRNPSATSSPRDHPHGGPGEPYGTFWSSGLHEGATGRERGSEPPELWTQQSFPEETPMAFPLIGGLVWGTSGFSTQRELPRRTTLGLQPPRGRAGGWESSRGEGRGQHVRPTGGGPVAPGLSWEAGAWQVFNEILPVLRSSA